MPLFVSKRSLLGVRRAVLGRPRTAAAVVGALLLLYVGLISAPISFPTGAYVHIRSGETLSDAARVLKDRGVIRSEVLFSLLVRLFGGERSITAGEYFFPYRQNIFVIAERMGSGDFQVEPTRVRIVEGSTVEEVGIQLAESIPGFNLVEFVQKTRGKEGYLFPDTYFFMPGQDVNAILGAIDSNFNANIASVQSKIDAFGVPLSEVIVMASLLEREAPNTYDRRVIAGILWKRIELGMPLQVDAVFPYIIGKNTFELTRADLKTNSPYNTYTNKGLPPGPIANPSLDAIIAAVTPVETNYLFYLSDLDGTMHYSATYTQHLAAKDRYLDN